jgi:hypothetical protein
MSFFEQAPHQNASILMDSVASHCIMDYFFANTFWLRVKKNSNIWY